MDTIIKFAPNIHAEITQEANNDFLNPEDLSAVIFANTLQDAHQFNSSYHFDNCTFKLGVEYIQNQWKNIENIGDIYNKQSLCCFGQLLHAVQDFYSHSNWIELHTDKEVLPIWNLEIQTLPKNIVSGTFTLGEPKCCVQNTPTHEELNKDKANSKEGKKTVKEGPNKGLTLYNLAYFSAVKATVIQFNKLNEVKKKNNIKNPYLFKSIDSIEEILTLLYTNGIYRNQISR